jgi:hypothetical protein
MLVGEPPHSSEQSAGRIDAAGELVNRLAKYRALIEGAAPPSKQLRRPGIDRPLVEIINRCLAPNPDDRYANVQEVLTALEARDAARARRPLTVLGIVGPLLLLIIMTIFGGRWYRRAMARAEAAVHERVYQKNEWVARHVARSIEDEIARYFEVVQWEATQPELLERFSETTQLATLRALRTGDPTAEELAARREAFIADPERGRLKTHLQNRLDSYLDRLAADPREPKFASMFALDADGTMLASVYNPSLTTKSVGKNYSWRTYFHGGQQDLPPDTRPPTVRPIEKTHLSAMFQSTTTNLWKVAVSTPIYGSENGHQQLVGVMALTVNLGDFAYIRSKNRKHHFAVLVDGRPGQRMGTVLQHPLFDDNRALRSDYRVSAQQLGTLQSKTLQIYDDPLGKAPGGDDYRGAWIAAMEPVHLPDEGEASGGPNAMGSKLIVLVQESYEAATAPVKQLGTRLVFEGILALCVVIVVIASLWFFVVRSFGRSQLAAHPTDRPTTGRDGS